VFFKLASKVQMNLRAEVISYTNMWVMQRSYDEISRVESVEELQQIEEQLRYRS
jgi:hypothetical protein